MYIQSNYSIFTYTAKLLEVFSQVQSIYEYPFQLLLKGFHIITQNLTSNGPSTNFAIINIVLKKTFPLPVCLLYTHFHLSVHKLFSKGNYRFTFMEYSINSFFYFSICRKEKQ